MDFESLLYPLRTVLNVYIIFLNTLLFYSLLSPKPHLRKSVIFAGTFVCCGLSLLFSLLLYDHYFLKLFLSLLTLSLFPGLFYRTKLTHRFLASSLFLLLLILSEGMIAALTTLLFGSSALLQVSDPNLNTAIIPLYFLSYTICFGIITLVCWRKHQTGTVIDLTRFLVLPLSQVVSLGGLLYALYLRDRVSLAADSLLLFVCLGFSIAADIIFLRLVDDLIKKKRLEDQQELQKRHYTALLEQERAMRKLRHDIANHIMTIGLLVGKDDTRAKAYLDELTNRFQKNKATRFCENQIADMVLFSKAAEATAHEIHFSAQAEVSENIGLNDLDFMSLLSNLLDNALEAAARAEDRLVEVFLREHAGTLVLKIRNSVASGVHPDLSRTTKRNAKEHGLGLEIVREICRKYHGEFLTNTKEGMFEVSVLLLLPSQRMQ